MLKLDSEFKETYIKYYGKMAPHEVLTVVNDDIKGYSGFSLVNLFNIAKTSAILGQTYIEFYIEAAKDYSLIVSDPDEIDQFIFNGAFHYIFSVDPAALEYFLDIRFRQRDIYAEIAYNAYGRSDEESIKRIKSVSTEDTYSIQAPNPVSRDQWFYNLAVAVGSYSKCHSRKIGAVLVKDNSVISTGYNGPPRGVPPCDQRWFIDQAFKEKYGHHMLNTEHDDIEFKTTKGVCPRRVIGFPSGEGLGVCPAGHAERNALINAARLGIKTNNTKIYMSCGVPCSPCMVEIINSGVEEIICSAMSIYDETALYLLENSDLKVRIYDFLV